MKSYVQLVSGTSKLFQPRDHITRLLSFFKQPACLECCSRLLQMEECLGQIAVITAQQSPFLMGASHLQQNRAGREGLETSSHMCFGRFPVWRVESEKGRSLSPFCHPFHTFTIPSLHLSYRFLSKTQCFFA